MTFYVAKRGASDKSPVVVLGPLADRAAVEVQLRRLPDGEYDIAEIVERVALQPRPVVSIPVATQPPSDGAESA